MPTDLQFTPAVMHALVQGDLANAIVAATPGGIEQQEAQGQQALMSDNALPLEINGCTRSDLEQIGFVFGNVIDNLFVECVLPRGWSKRATDHSMWSDLLDDNDCLRARIFYKAAFYDRTADVRFVSRYDIRPYEKSTTNPSMEMVTVFDRKHKVVIFESCDFDPNVYADREAARTTADIFVQQFFSDVNDRRVLETWR